MVYLIANQEILLNCALCLPAKQTLQYNILIYNVLIVETCMVLTLMTNMMSDTSGTCRICM